MKFSLAGLMKLSVLLAIAPLNAVIVGGTSGTGNNNSDEAGLNGFLATTVFSPFPYYTNLVRVGDASGVYLGWNYATDRGWVVSAQHVGAPATIGVNGNSYAVVAGTNIAGSDIKLYEVSRGPSPIPSMPTVTLGSSEATLGEVAIMTGRGYTNDTSGPFDWEIPGYSDAVAHRWATNTISAIGSINLGSEAVPNIHQYLVTDFDGPSGPGVTPYDGQGASGDSGGGLFVYRSGQWQLAGIAHFVDDGPTFGPPFGTVNPSEFGDFTAYTDVFQHRSIITGLTGTLIPEPTSTWLLIMAGTCVLRRRVAR